MGKRSKRKKKKSYCRTKFLQAMEERKKDRWGMYKNVTRCGRAAVARFTFTREQFARHATLLRVARAIIIIIAEFARRKPGRGGDDEEEEKKKIKK